MIKLKQLIEESGAFRWNTPDNTPDAVIQFYHLLVAHILKQKKNPKEYVGIFHDEPDELFGDKWTIINKRRPSDSIHFDAADGQWKQSEYGLNFEPITNNELKHAIQNWV